MRKGSSPVCCMETALFVNKEEGLVIITLKIILYPSTLDPILCRIVCILCTLKMILKINEKETERL